MDSYFQMLNMVSALLKYPGGQKFRQIVVILRARLNDDEILRIIAEVIRMKELKKLVEIN